MPTSLEPPPRTTDISRGEILQILRRELAATVTPLAPLLGCSIELEIDGEIDRIAPVLDRSELCSRTTDRPVAGGVFQETSKVVEIPILSDGGNVGLCRIDASESRPEVVEAIERIVRGQLERISLERQESLLLTELAACWESLEALYDVHALPEACRSTDAIIDWIRNRVIEGQSGLESEFWLEVDGRFIPKAIGRRDGRPPSADIEALIERSVAEDRWIVVDPLRPGSTLPDHPERWSRDLRLLVAPSNARHGTRGALVVWGTERTRSFDSRMLRHAQSLATQAVMALEGDRLSQAALQHELVQEEMEIGSEMQRILLLGDKPSALGFAQVASLAIPSQKLGGDFLEFFHLSGMHLDILIGDVMGKGLRASLVGAAITRQFHRTLCSLVTADPNCHAAPETIVSSVHEGVARRLAEFDSFVTLDYARVDAFRGRLDYVDCGHPPILHFRKALGRCDALYGKNVPLGFSDLEVYEQVSVPYEDGDVFVFYSDGVTELRNAAGELFGMERLIALIESTAAEASPDSLTKSIRRALMDFAGGEQTDDDLTLVVVRMSRVPVPESSGLAKTIEIPSDLEQLEACRSFIRSICMQRGRQILDEDAIGLLELAVTEVASNIMIHGQAGFDDPRIRLEGEVFDDSVLVRFDYAGRSFDPTATRPPDFDGSRESGFGVYLTSQCVDQVNYNCKGDGANFIVMIKNRN